MKTSLKTSILLCIGLMITSLSYASPPKTLEVIEKQNIEFDFLRFCNYLENGAPHRLEGVYTSPDQRYKVAIVKNDAKHHDYIGIVISADNQYWKAGDVKFNFVLKDSLLQGYFYNHVGREIPIQFNIVADSIDTDCLKRVL